MSINYKALRRPAAALAALALVVGSAAPALLGPSSVSAIQVTSRKVQMSDSAPSGGAITSGTGSGTNVTYQIKFTPNTTSSIGGIVIDICANTPLVGDTSCTLPAGFTWDTDSTPAATLSTGVGGTWTPGSMQGGGADANHPQVLTMSNGTPATPSGEITITVTGVTNPNTTNLANDHYSFFARIVTFNTSANMGTQYTATGTTRAASFANMVDYGGAAMSLQTIISITARVMETMALCTSSVVMTSDCTSQATPSIELGANVNGTIVLGTALSTDDIYSQVSTNASNGYGIYMKARYACGGLSKDSGATCEIPPVNSGGAAAAAINAGDGEFGVQVGNGTGDSGTNTAVARWAQSGSNFIMDITTASDGVDDTYGSLVADSYSEGAGNKQADSVNNTYTFGAAASSTTPAGIYSQGFVLVAVGTF